MLETLINNFPIILIPLNLIVLGLGVIVSIVYGLKAKIATGDAKILAIGIAATAGGLSIQSIYWMVTRMIHEFGKVELYSILAWLTIAPLFLIIYGYLRHLELAIKDHFGNHWLLKYNLFLISIYSYVLLALITMSYTYGS